MIATNNSADQNSSTDAPIPPIGAKVIGRWPEGAIVYQVYPRSLQDSNGDGIGDIPGIIQRLGHIKSLGVNAIWLSPFYPSPMADFGYDVADYCGVDPIFGTLDDFKRLLAEATRLDIRVIIDLVPNHSSDEHPWFEQSRMSRSNQYSDWYIWRDGRQPDESEVAGTDARPLPPNNWRDALTGGSAWQWDDTRQQYYLHSFDVKQPDLNWGNPAVRTAIKDAMRFWLGLGVDGFRVDAVYWMAKDPMMRDDPPNPDYVKGEDSPYEALLHTNSSGWPPVYSYLSEMDEVLKEKPFQDKARFMVTEAYPNQHNHIASYLSFYAGVDPLVAAPFNFEGIALGWEAAPWHRFLKSFHQALDEQSPLCVASYAFGNHDQPRLASRIGGDAARSAAIMLMTLPGMAFVYYGDEIGMVDGQIPADKVQDPNAKGDPAKGQGRDPERTPMQWDDSQNAGFSTVAEGETWLPIQPDYRERNVANQSGDPGSVLELYRSLGRLRNQSNALRFGNIRVLDIDVPGVLAYVRSVEDISNTPDSDDNSYVVILNYNGEAAACPIEPLKLMGLQPARLKLTVSSLPEETARSDSINVDLISASAIQLRPHQAVVFAVQP